MGVTMSELLLPDPASGPLHGGNLLNAVIRRDITDLNRLFLECALDPALSSDAWFRLPEPAFTRFAQAEPDVRERAAHSPVALFELELPPENGFGHDAVADSVDDNSTMRRAGVRRSFGVAVLQVVRRMAESTPLSPRIAFGLPPVAEARARTLTLCESYRLACWSGLIHPRWPDHARYWTALADASTNLGGDVMHWAYSAGLCLLGQCEREPSIVRYGPRRQPRPVHRRGPAGSADVPC